MIHFPFITVKVQVSSNSPVGMEEKGDSGRMTYGNYLRLEEMLKLQKGLMVIHLSLVMMKNTSLSFIKLLSYGSNL